MLTTLAPFLSSIATPLVTSVQFAVPVESKGLYAITCAIGAIPITPLPSCGATIRLATAVPWPLEKVEMPS